MAPAGSDHSYLINELRAGLALVFIDRPPAFLDADTVVTANRDGARDGVRHLIDHGHRRIAYLGDLRTIATANERFAGYREALRQAAIAPDEALVRQGLHSIQTAEQAVIELCRLPRDRAPTALFTSQNMVTVGAVKALRRIARQHEIALVGFDDILLADLLEPGLTVIAQDPTAIGTAAAGLLFHRLDGDVSPTHLVVVPTRLVARGSGEIPPVT